MQHTYIHLEGRTLRFPPVFIYLLQFITFGLYSVIRKHFLFIRLFVETYKSPLKGSKLVLVTNEHNFQQLVGIKKVYINFTTKLLKRFVRNKQLFYLDAMFYRFFFDFVSNKFVVYSNDSKNEISTQECVSLKSHEVDEFVKMNRKFVKDLLHYEKMKNNQSSENGRVSELPAHGKGQNSVEGHENNISNDFSTNDRKKADSGKNSKSTRRGSLKNKIAFKKKKESENNLQFTHDSMSFMYNLELLESYILFGLNTTHSNYETTLQIILRLVMDPLLIYTFFGVILWTFINYYLYASLVGLLTLFSLVSDFLMEYSKNSSLKKLSQSTRYILVYRNGVWENINTLFIFPGDVVAVSPMSDFVADCRIESGEVIVDEGFLTGETVPIVKNKDSGSNLVYAGTDVVKSVGTCIYHHIEKTGRPDRIKVKNIRKRPRTPNDSKKLKNIHKKEESNLCGQVTYTDVSYDTPERKNDPFAIPNPSILDSHHYSNAYYPQPSCLSTSTKENHINLNPKDTIIEYIDSNRVEIKHHRSIAPSSSPLLVSKEIKTSDSFSVGKVVATGFSTSKGALVRNIMVPRPIKFIFYRETSQVILSLFILGIFVAVPSIFFYYWNSVSLKTAIIYGLDLILCILSPALPATIKIGCTIAAQRLKKQRIICFDANRINLAGNATMAIFDKTGTLTSEGLDLICIDTIQHRFKGLEKIDNKTKEALSVCHNISLLNDELAGDPLDVKMFQFSEARITATQERTILVKKMKKMKKPVKENRPDSSCGLSKKDWGVSKDADLSKKKKETHFTNCLNDDYSEFNEEKQCLDTPYSNSNAYNENTDAKFEDENQNDQSQPFYDTADYPEDTFDCIADVDLPVNDDTDTAIKNNNGLLCKRKVSETESIVFFKAGNKKYLKEDFKKVKIHKVFDFDNKLRRMGVVCSTIKSKRTSSMNIIHLSQKSNASTENLKGVSMLNSLDFQNKNLLNDTEAQSTTKTGISKNRSSDPFNSKAVKPYQNENDHESSFFMNQNNNDGNIMHSNDHSVALNYVERDLEQNEANSFQKNYELYKMDSSTNNRDLDKDCNSDNRSNQSNRYVDKSDLYTVYIKGSPESIQKLLVSTPEDYEDVVKDYALDGYRIIAIGYKKIATIESQDREFYESNLTFLCFVVFANKLKPETKPTLSALKKATIDTRMATGDNILTAISVARLSKMIDKYTPVIFPVLDENAKSVYDAQWLCLSDEELTFDKIRLTLHKGEDRSSYNDFFVACEGREYDFMKRESLEYFNFILQKGVVFARMNPDQKQALVEDINNLGHCTIFCGDGANDCGALTAADVGISLADNESSIASSFISTIKNVSSVKTLIKEGRNALVTSYNQFIFILTASLIQFMSLFILSIYFHFLGDLQTAFTDFLIIMVIAQGMNTFQGSKKLHKSNPKSKIYTIDTILLVFSICFISYSSFLILFKMFYDGFIDCGDFVITSKVGSAFFIVSNCQITTIGYILSEGKPHRIQRRNNLMYTLSCIFTFVMNILANLVCWEKIRFLPILNEILEIEKYDLYDLCILLAVVLGNLLLIPSVYCLIGFFFNEKIIKK